MKKLLIALSTVTALLLSMNVFADNKDNDGDGMPPDWEVNLTMALDRLYGVDTRYSFTWYDQGTSIVSVIGNAVTRDGNQTTFYCESPAIRINWFCVITGR